MLPILVLVILYLYLGYLRLRKDKESLSIYFTLLSSLLVVAFLIMYAYSTTPNPLVNFGEDRIYFIHSCFFAIIWAMIVKAFFGLKNKKTYLIAAVLITALYLFQNIPSIYQDMDNDNIHSQIAANDITEMRSHSSNFNANYVIV
jgi:small basic protein